MGLSLTETLRRLPPPDRADRIARMPVHLLTGIRRGEWWAVSRPEQYPPDGPWAIWLIMSGRGWGKTRTGAEALIDAVMQSPYDMDGIPTEWGAFAQTLPDARSIVAEGPSGLARCLQRRRIPYDYRKAPMEFTLPQGQKIHVRGADDPDVGRGFNLAGTWLDEMAKWRWSMEAWTEGIMPSLRVLTASGRPPRAIVTTTPKPIPLLKDWTTRTDGSVTVTRGSTFDNADNLSPVALAELERRYHGTRIGRQELFGELLGDVEGALFPQSLIDRTRRNAFPDPATIVRTVVGIDPAITSNQNSDETGIVSACYTTDDHVYVLNDCTVKASPDEWARIAIQEYERTMADCIVVEANQGGDAWRTIIHTIAPNLPVKMVHASVGKKARAEPVAALMEQDRLHIVGTLGDLESQISTWTPYDKESPDRLDAMVWACTELAFKRRLAAVQTFAT